MALTPIKDVRQIPGEPFRQWYSSRECDLIVWYKDSLEVKGFQFCYRQGHQECALTWMDDRGYSHHKVDNGEVYYGTHKQTPILVGEDNIRKTIVRQIFNKENQNVRPTVVRLVNDKLDNYPA